jgi:hypothetical protein
MRTLATTILCFFAVTAMAEASSPAVKIDKSRVTVSGISSGAAMAHQLHIAYSDIFSGAAIFSGVPYYCAENSLMTALKRCTENTDQALPVEQFIAKIREGGEAGLLADPANLADDRVYLFHGSLDTKVSSLVHDATAKVYAGFIEPGRMRAVSDVAAGHVFPAMQAEHNCTELVPPFVGDCDFDGAGELLSFLYPDLVTPQAAAETGLLEAEIPGADDAYLMETGYLFVPPACNGAGEPCALHLVLHGCAQSSETIGTDFIAGSGYLPWAEANDIVLAFPQVRKSLVAPINPHGCWDWWGYTGDDYANRNGKQMAALAGWIESISE